MPTSNRSITCCSVTSAKNTIKNWWQISSRRNLKMKVKKKRWRVEIEECRLTIRERFLSMALSIKIIACISWRYLRFQGKQISPLSRNHHLILRLRWGTKEKSWMEWWWRSYFPSSWRNFFRKPCIRATKMTSGQSNTISTNISPLALSSPSSCDTSCFPSMTSNLQGISMRKSTIIPFAPHFVMLSLLMAYYAKTIFMRSILGARCIQLNKMPRRLFL